jgi:hypothetical protein
VEGYRISNIEQGVVSERFCETKRNVRGANNDYHGASCHGASYIHRGWNQFDDTDGLDDISFIGGLKWQCSDDTEIRWGMTVGEQGPNNTVVMYDLVLIKQLNDRLKYVLQHNNGNSNGGSDSHFMPGEWYGIVNYLQYEINDCWSAGARFEWFRDVDGTIAWLAVAIASSQE